MVITLIEQTKLGQSNYFTNEVSLNILLMKTQLKKMKMRDGFVDWRKRLMYYETHNYIIFISVLLFICGTKCFSKVTRELVYLLYSLKFFI